MSRARAATALVGVVLALGAGCAARRTGGLGPGALRRGARGGAGDARRRASMRLVVDGLDAEPGAATSALSHYEYALGVDPTNPFAYLVLARHYVERGDAEGSLEYLDQAEILLASEGVGSPRVEAHLAGLRGLALQELGRVSEAAPLLARARTLSPSVWGDEWLTASELR